MESTIVWLEEITLADVARVGQKAAYLGQLMRANRQIPILPGFVILKEGNDFPQQLQDALVENVRKLSARYGKKTVLVALRTSPYQTGSMHALGTEETILNINGERALIAACKKLFKTCPGKAAFLVQVMAETTKGCSGIATTADVQSGFPDIVRISTVSGNGKKLTRGNTNSFDYIIFKPTFFLGKNAVLQTPQKNILSREDLRSIARLSLTIEQIFKHHVVVEWVKDSITAQVFIVDVYPLQVEKTQTTHLFELTGKGPLLLRGEAVGCGIAAGTVLKMADAKHARKDSILVAKDTDPRIGEYISRIAGLITEKGSRTSHLALLAREHNVPCIVGVTNATNILRTNQQITLDCSHGEKGNIYGGLLSYEKKKQRIEKRVTRTKIKANIGDPSQAFSVSMQQPDGIGLARMEFIISNAIGIHPLALLHYDSLHASLKKEINRKTEGYKTKTHFFVDKLTVGIATIAAAVYPKPVAIRFSDFKTNEYRELLGGKNYEKEEENPMIGWRGACRYYSEPYKNAFLLECEAVRKAREEFGFRNIELLIPFCRTPDEAAKVLALLEQQGLQRGVDGLKIHLMCEIPSNVILADKFLDLVDGYSLGSNDLTQLTYGIDRDSEKLHGIASENSAAIKRSIAHVAKLCKKKKKSFSVCGDAASTFNEFAEFVIEQGVDSISVSSDALPRVRKFVEEKEEHLHAKPLLFSKLKMH